jgi:formamidopyrimidine-DNA glycosylase
MPEVCEVALTGEILEKYLKGKVLTDIEFVSGRYGPGRTKPVGFEEVHKLLPMKVVKVDTRGKFLWFDLVNDKDQHLYVWNTFGLTGMWSLYEPKFWRATFTFEKGLTAYFSDMRNFGTFKFSTSKPELDKKLKLLSPDFLKDNDFSLEKITKYKKPIVAVLMDQKAVGSGLGNYLVAEILYRACISPHRLGSSLTEDELDSLKYWIKYMVKLCYIDNHIGYMVNLEKETNQMKRKDYHADIRLGDKEFDFQVYRKKIDPFGNKVKAEEIIKGRTTYWVPSVQS